MDDGNKENNYRGTEEGGEPGKFKRIDIHGRNGRIRICNEDMKKKLERLEKRWKEKKMKYT